MNAITQHELTRLINEQQILVVVVHLLLPSSALLWVPRLSVFLIVCVSRLNCCCRRLLSAVCPRSHCHVFYSGLSEHRSESDRPRPARSIATSRTSPPSRHFFVLLSTMANRYDSRTTMFSPEGRLHQVEYAIQAISQAGAAVGILSKEGVVLAAEKRITSKLLDIRKSTEKMYKIDDHCAVAVAGITSDANILLNHARLIAQRYLFAYQEPIPIEQLLQQICDIKQGYTQFGGLRPFGVSFLFAGWDEHYGFQMYQSDPSGNYGRLEGAGHRSQQCRRTEHPQERLHGGLQSGRRAHAGRQGAEQDHGHHQPVSRQARDSHSHERGRRGQVQSVRQGGAEGTAQEGGGHVEGGSEQGEWWRHMSAPLRHLYAVCTVCGFKSGVDRPPIEPGTIHCRGVSSVLRKAGSHIRAQRSSSSRHQSMPRIAVWHQSGRSLGW